MPNLAFQILAALANMWQGIKKVEFNGTTIKEEQLKIQFLIFSLDVATIPEQGSTANPPTTPYSPNMTKHKTYDFHFYIKSLRSLL